jgi:hypothetical protein
MRSDRPAEFIDSCRTDMKAELPAHRYLQIANQHRDAEIASFLRYSRQCAVALQL